VALTPVRIPRPLKKSLAKKTPQMQDAILSCIRQLRVDWSHPGLRASSMKGRPGVFEAKVDRRNRVTFFWDGPVIVVENHCKHDIVSK
jgi:hypothetical protein